MSPQKQVYVMAAPFIIIGTVLCFAILYKKIAKQNQPSELGEDFVAKLRSDCDAKGKKLYISTLPNGMKKYECIN